MSGEDFPSSARALTRSLVAPTSLPARPSAALSLLNVKIYRDAFMLRRMTALQRKMLLVCIVGLCIAILSLSTQDWRDFELSTANSVALQTVWLAFFVPSCVMLLGALFATQMHRVAAFHCMWTQRVEKRRIEHESLSPFSSSTLGCTPTHPKTTTELWAAFFDHLPAGTFMVSYAWGSKVSKICARQLASLFLNNACWLDCHELIPGEHIQRACVSAVRNSRVQFVFLSHSYLNSKNCLAELEEISRHPERAIIIVDDLGEHEAQLIAEVKRREFSNFSCMSHLLLRFGGASMENILSAGGEKFLQTETNMRKWVTREHVLALLLDTNTLPHVFQSTSPAVNMGWLHTAARLTKQPFNKELKAGLLMVAVGYVVYLSFFTWLYSNYVWDSNKWLWMHTFVVVLATLLISFVSLLDLRVTKPLEQLPDCMLLAIVLNKLKLFPAVSVVMQIGDLCNPICTALSTLEKFGVVHIIQFAENIADNEDIFFVADISKLANPLRGIESSSSGVYLCDQFATVTAEQRQRFANHFVLETLASPETIVEVVGVRLLLHVLRGKLFPGAYPFSYFSDSQRITELKLEICASEQGGDAPEESLLTEKQVSELRKVTKPSRVNWIHARKLVSIWSRILLAVFPWACLLSCLVMVVENWTIVRPQWLEVESAIICSGVQQDCVSRSLGNDEVVITDGSRGVVQVFRVYAGTKLVCDNVTEGTNCFISWSS